jgi:hypothetical protein
MAETIDRNSHHGTRQRRPQSTSAEESQLKRADEGGRVPGRHLDGLIQVRALQHGKSGDLLLGLGERPIAHQHLTGANLDGGCRTSRPQEAAADKDAASFHLRVPGLDRPSFRIALRIRAVGIPPVDGGLIDTVNHQVSHPLLPFLAASAVITSTTRRQRPDGQAGGEI